MDFLKIREWWIWVAAIVALAFMPFGNGHSLCISHLVGLGDCMGCGLGSGIHSVLRGQFADAWNHHFMAIPATLIILLRIYQLTFHTTNHIQKRI